MPSKTYSLTDENGPHYTRAEVMELEGLRDDSTLRRWERQGVGPPLTRHGRLHSRVRYPRASYWAWVRQRMAEAAEATR